MDMLNDFVDYIASGVGNFTAFLIKIVLYYTLTGATLFVLANVLRRVPIWRGKAMAYLDEVARIENVFYAPLTIIPMLVIITLIIIAIKFITLI